MPHVKVRVRAGVAVLVTTKVGVSAPGGRKLPKFGAVMESLGLTVMVSVKLFTEVGQLELQLELPLESYNPSSGAVSVHPLNRVSVSVTVAVLPEKVETEKGGSTHPSSAVCVLTVPIPEPVSTPLAL